MNSSKNFMDSNYDLLMSFCLENKDIEIPNECYDNIFNIDFNKNLFKFDNDNLNEDLDNFQNNIFSDINNNESNGFRLVKENYNQNSILSENEKFEKSPKKINFSEILNEKKSDLEEKNEFVNFEEKFNFSDSKNDKKLKFSDENVKVNYSFSKEEKTNNLNKVINENNGKLKFKTQNNLKMNSENKTFMEKKSLLIEEEKRNDKINYLLKMKKICESKISKFGIVKNLNLKKISSQTEKNEKEKILIQLLKKNLTKNNKKNLSIINQTQTDQIHDNSPKYLYYQNHNKNISLEQNNEILINNSHKSIYHSKFLKLLERNMFLSDLFSTEFAYHDFKQELEKMKKNLKNTEYSIKGKFSEFNDLIKNFSAEKNEKIFFYFFISFLTLVNQLDEMKINLKIFKEFKSNKFNANLIEEEKNEKNNLLNSNTNKSRSPSNTKNPLMKDYIQSLTSEKEKIDKKENKKFELNPIKKLNFDLKYSKTQEIFEELDENKIQNFQEINHSKSSDIGMKNNNTNISNNLFFSTEILDFPSKSFGLLKKNSIIKENKKSDYSEKDNYRIRDEIELKNIKENIINENKHRIDYLDEIRVNARKNKVNMKYTFNDKNLNLMEDNSNCVYDSLRNENNKFENSENKDFIKTKRDPKFYNTQRETYSNHGKNKISENNPNQYNNFSPINNDRFSQSVNNKKIENDSNSRNYFINNNKIFLFQPIDQNNIKESNVLSKSNLKFLNVNNFHKNKDSSKNNFMNKSSNNNFNINNSFSNYSSKDFENTRYPDNKNEKKLFLNKYETPQIDNDEKIGNNSDNSRNNYSKRNQFDNYQEKNNSFNNNPNRNFNLKENTNSQKNYRKINQNNIDNNNIEIYNKDFSVIEKLGNIRIFNKNLEYFNTNNNLNEHNNKENIYSYENRTNTNYKNQFLGKKRYENENFYLNNK